MTFQQQTGQSFEQVVESSSQLQGELNEAIMKTSTVLARYATRIRPASVQYTPELIAHANATLTACAMAVVNSIEPQSGRLRIPRPSDQATQAELQAWRRLATIAAGAPRGAGGRNRRRARQQQFALT